MIGCSLGLVDTNKSGLGFTGREALRNRGTYTVIKLAHEAETDANVGSGSASKLIPSLISPGQISEHIIRLVGLLKRDEGAESSRDVLEVRQFGEEELTVDGKGAKGEADEELEIEVL